MRQAWHLENVGQSKLEIFQYCFFTQLVSFSTLTVQLPSQHHTNYQKINLSQYFGCQLKTAPFNDWTSSTIQKPDLARIQIPTLFRFLSVLCLSNLCLTRKRKTTSACPSMNRIKTPSVKIIVWHYSNTKWSRTITTF